MAPMARNALWALALVTAVLFPLTPSAGLRDLLQTAVTAACLVIAWQALVRQPDLLGRGWGLLALSVSLLGVSDALLAVEEHVVDFDGHPRPSNILALAGYGLMGVGVLVFERRRGRGRPLPGRIEAAIFACGALTPLLVFLILPVLQADDLSFAGKSTTVGYAVADLVVVTVIARVVLSDRQQTLSLLFLGSGLFVSLLGDFWSGITTTQGPASALVPIRMLWLFAFILFAAGVAHPSLREFTLGAAWQAGTSKRRLWLMGVGQALPALTLGVVWLIGGTPYEPVIAVGGLVVTVLVSARMTGLLDRISEQSVQLAALARSDDLTGLHNRRSWNHELSRACARARDTGAHLAIGLIDLDHFKRYNDTHGHLAGDRLLREAASRWRQRLGPADVLARYGGEEFAVILPGANLAEAVGRLEELRDATPDGESFSAGVALWRHGSDPAEAISEADDALYRAKHAGRGRVLASTASDAELLPAPLRAMNPVVQPIVRAGDGRVVGYEALSRFPHSNDVEGVFADAHRSGYGDLLECMAITKALDLEDRPDGVELFVNVSERAMRSDRFWESLPDDLTSVVVELHEDRDGLDDTSVAELLGRFRDRGARIGLDDLGVRATDLARIVTLRPDVLKVDRSLVSGCDEHPGQAEVIRMLVDFALGHGAEVCVEGVETDGELGVVEDAGATLVQGFLLGRPASSWRPAPEHVDADEHDAAGARR